MPDGSVIRTRSASKSGGPTFDITGPNGEPLKVHIDPCTLEDLASDVLERGLDDWVYLAEVDYVIRDRLRSEPPEVIKDNCFAVLEYLLTNRLAEVGDLRSVGGGVQFVPWGMGPGASLSEAKRRWSQFGGPRDASGANDVCWLSNTEAGDELARRRSDSC